MNGISHLISDLQVTRARAEGFEQGIEDLMTYLLDGEKFPRGSTVQVADVLRRLQHAHAMAVEAEFAATKEQAA